MTEENAVLLMKTKAGNGLKLRVDGVWLFTSIKNVEELLSGSRKGCSFEPISSSE